MGKRPLCVALLFLVIGIVIVHSKWEDRLPVYEGEMLTLYCELEEFTGESDSITLLVRDIQCSQKHLCHRMKIYAGGDTRMSEELHIGNLLQVEASVISFSKPGNPGQFNEYQYNTEQGISYKGFASEILVLDARRDNLRDGLHQLQSYFRHIVDRCCDAKTAGIVAAMVLGDKGGLSEDTQKLYQQNGIAHILAISGLHISLIGAGLFYLLRRYVMPMHMAVITTVVFLMLYGTLTGFSVSTKRAVIMMMCMLGARFVGKHYDLLSALALSAIIQLMLHPFILYQTGFQLSYGTVLGIALFVRRLQKIELNKYFFSHVWLGSLGIQMVTFPIILSSYYEIPLYSVAANVILLPLLGGILLASIAGIGIGCWKLLLGKFCFGFVHYCLAFFDAVCHVLNHIPFHNIILGAPERWQIVLYYAALIAWCLFEERFPSKRNFVILIFSLVIICLPVHRVSGLKITNLDVGQGDCTCIRTEQEAMLIDGGSSDVSEVGKYRIVPYLKSQGISQLDYIFLTHSDEDHTNGIVEILKDTDYMGLEIGKLVLPDIEKQDESYQELKKLCERAGIATILMKKGDRITMGDLEISCLHPYFSYDWQSENDYSLTLQLQYKKFSGLLTGDLEDRGEKELEALTHVDYLKVAHHGSKGSSGKEFLQKISPDISVLSAGKNNRYGHPSFEVIERLAKVGSRSYCTIESGAVTVQTDGEKIQVETWRGEAERLA